MKRKKMKHSTIFSAKTYTVIMIVLFLFSFGNISAQEEDVEKQKKEARILAAEAEKALAENNFEEAEAMYRKAIAKDPQNADARYNLGNLYYNKDKNGEASQRLSQSAEITDNKILKHRSFHNYGNSMMRQKNYEQAVEAYKNALRNNPTDDETRYNLALAKEMLQKQQEEQQNDDQDQDQDQEQQDQENQEGGEDQKDEGDQSEEGDQGEDEQESDQDQSGGDQEQEEGEQEQQEQQQPEQQEEGDNQAEEQQPVQGQLSPQQMQNLLEAMENQEKEIQDKINAQRAKGQKSNSEKDW